MPNRNVIRAAIVALAATLLAAGAASASNDAAKAASKDVVTFEELVPPRTFDPQQSLSNEDIWAWQYSYECLLKPSASGGLLPALATHWKVSANRRVYTFTLRRGVLFHNGAKFTSADVVYTFKRLKKSGIPYAQDQFPTVTSVRAVGPYSVRFTLSEPTPGFLFSMANPVLAGCAILTSHPGKAKLALKMIGTGPYAMTSYKPNQELDLKAFDRYWGPKPRNAGVRVLYVPNTNTQVADVRSGKADIIIADSSIVGSLRSTRGVKIYDSPPNLSELLFINSAIKPWSDVRVRRAIALAIDRQAIVNVAYAGEAVPTGFLPGSYSWGIKLGQTNYSHRDVEKAKQLLASAGYPNGLEGKLMWKIGGSAEVKREMELVQSQLADVGIRITLDPQEAASWSDKFNKPGRPIPDYDLSWNSYGVFSDPFQFLRLRDNRQGPTPPKLQKLIDNLTKAKNVDQYHRMLNAIARMEADLAFPAVPLVRSKTHFAARSDLRGVVPPESGSRVFLARVSKS